MKSKGWRDVGKGFKPQLQGTEGFCVSVAKVGRRGLATTPRMPGVPRARVPVCVLYA